MGPGESCAGEKVVKKDSKGETVLNTARRSSRTRMLMQFII